PRRLGTWEPGPEERVLSGYVSRPAKLDGVRRWNIASITPYRLINALAWSPDSRQLACVSCYGDPYNLRVFDRHTGRPTLIAQIRGLWEPQTTDVVWSPDNRSL